MTIRVSSPTVAPVATYMHTQFPAAVLRESYHHTVEYQLPPGEDLANVFGRLEAARDELCIDDYSVCQTTLDQVTMLTSVSSIGLLPSNAISPSFIKFGSILKLLDFKCMKYDDFLR